MLIVTATNVTRTRANKGKCGQPILAREDGTADYDVWVGINHHCLWRGEVNGHVRDVGAEVLLRLIADKMQTAREMEDAMPVLTRFLRDAAMGEPSEALMEHCRQKLNEVLRAGMHKQKGRSAKASLRRKIKPIVKAALDKGYCGTCGDSKPECKCKGRKK